MAPEISPILDPGSHKIKRLHAPPLFLNRPVRASYRTLARDAHSLLFDGTIVPSPYAGKRTGGSLVDRTIETGLEAQAEGTATGS